VVENIETLTKSANQNIDIDEEQLSELAEEENENEEYEKDQNYL
jgi:hypothetical protein